VLGLYALSCPTLFLYVCKCFLWTNKWRWRCNGCVPTFSRHPPRHYLTNTLASTAVGHCGWACASPTFSNNFFSSLQSRTKSVTAGSISSSLSKMGILSCLKSTCIVFGRGSTPPRWRSLRITMLPRIPWSTGEWNIHRPHFPSRRLAYGRI